MILIQLAVDNGYTKSGPLPKVAPFRGPIAKLTRAVAAHVYAITKVPYLDMVLLIVCELHILMHIPRFYLYLCDVFREMFYEIIS